MFFFKKNLKIDPELEYKEFLYYIKNYYFNNKNKIFSINFENDYYYAEAVNKRKNNTYHFKLSKWYKQMILKKNNKNFCNDECSICCDNLGKKISYIKLCGHKFHTKCILKYIKKKNNEKLTCPICRRGPDIDLINKRKEKMNTYLCSNI